MAKKRNKKKRFSNQKVSLDSLVKKARQSLDSGKFRQAKDYYKKLCKNDPEKYTSGLVAAYRGLFDELVNKGRISNAKAVLVNLEKISGDPETDLARVALTIKQGDFSLAADQAVRCLLGNAQVFGKRDFFLADALVLCFELPEKINDLSSPAKSDLAAILSALEDLSQGEYVRALSTIRPVGIRSLFVHWKLFVKGLCAFYLNDDTKAQKAFSKLPPGSVPAKSAEAYLLLLDGNEGLKKNFKNIELMKQACVVAGRDDLVEALPRAEYLWHIRRFRDSYKHIRDNLTDFPSEASGVSHTLSTFYFNSIFHMEESLAVKFMGFLFSTEPRKRHFNPIELLLSSRAKALYMEKNDFDDEMLIESWKNFMEAYHEIHGENNALKAQMYKHLGDFFSVEELDINPFSFFSFGRRQKRPVLRNGGLAEWSYERSLDLDANNRDAHFSLLLFYEKLKDKSRVNKKLDEIIMLFPDDKEALLNAGLRCIDRKAFVKGMKYLECALELDPLDRRLKEQFIIAGIKTGKRYAENSQMEKCRALLPKVVDKASRYSERFNLGVPFVYARWAAFERLAGEDEISQQLMDKAVAIGKDSFRIHYFALLMARAYGVNGRQGKKIKKELNTLLSGKRSPEKAVCLAEIISYVQDIPGLDWLEEEAVKVNAFISKVAKQGFSRDQVETIVKYALSDPAKSPELAKRYIEKILINNPDDPLFRFYLFSLNKNRLGPVAPTEKGIEELHEILSLAEQKRDMRLVPLVKSALHEYEEMLSYWNDDDYWDDDDFDDDDLDDDDASEGFDFLGNFTLPEPDPGTKSKTSEKKDKTPYQGKQLNLFE